MKYIVFCLFLLFSFVKCDTTPITSTPSATETSVQQETTTVSSTESTGATIESTTTSSMQQETPTAGSTQGPETTTASSTQNTATHSYADLPVKDGKVVLPKEEWKKRLTSEQYKITRESGTEQAFTGALYENKKNGTYTCVCCGQELFSSQNKFDSGSGWPSFWQPIRNESIVDQPDNSSGMSRTETRCSRCDAHLGHVFDDGPKPTGLRYCINSASLNFVQAK